MLSLTSLYVALPTHARPTPATSTIDYTAKFAQWKKTHLKVYGTGAAESKAFASFTANDEYIQKHNSKGLSFTLGHNEFSDLTGDEFFSGHLGFKAALARHTTLSNTARLHTAPLNATLPSSVDWVSAGAVSGVKNQGTCGSCWAHSAAGAIEGAYAIATGSLVSLSPEELVQCDMVDEGCQGGLMDNAFTWVKSNGLAAEADYPYIDSDSGTSSRSAGTCSTSKEAKGLVTVSGYVDVSSDDEEALKSAVAQQPVSVAIEADRSAFQLYQSGVLDSSSCGTSLDHGVLLVGYGTDASSGKDYWKVKNSWGSSWGESGYVRMVRGSNMCGIASQPSYPTGATSYSATAAAA